MGILRLSHTAITAPDLDLAAAYYTEVLGLDLTAHTEDCLFLKGWDETDHHSLVVRFDPVVGIDRVSFKLEHESDLDELEARVEAAGVTVTRIADGEEVGQGESIRFQAPSGHEVELVHNVHKVGRRLPLINPGPYPEGLRGIAPPRADHTLLLCEEVGEISRFFMDILDFRLTEQILSSTGHQIAAFLQRSGRPHDIAFVQGVNGGLHHVSFWLDDWDHVRRAADVLAFNGIPVDIGPTRHGITRGNTIYFFDPMGTRNEVFTGGYRADPDFPTITWTEENLGRAIFYYEGKDNGRFLTVHT